MRASQFHFHTVKETPANAEIASHQLMLRAGMIRKLTSGIYSWTPMGLRVLAKVEAVVREEMNRAGALEMLMPNVQPADLWAETGRWDKFGAQLLKMSDRGGRDYAFGPTHEEVITDFARAELKSYKQLPISFYQIQTKFRDEIRPRFGVMRAREFLMKDAYSFHIDEASLGETYQVMYQAYSRIFERLNLQYRAVEADSGAIGGALSHEFHVLAEAGEDVLAYSESGEYAANVERAEALAIAGDMPSPAENSPQTVETPNCATVADVAELLAVPQRYITKTLIVENHEGELIALLLRGDHELNETKAGKLEELAGGEFTMASEEKIRAAVGAGPGSLGPVGLSLPIYADLSVVAMPSLICGANKDGYHLTSVSLERDIPEFTAADLRNVVDGDTSPDGSGKLLFTRGIEVGHIFQLGDKYSKAMNAVVLDEGGRARPMQMGCYGVGVSRIVAAAIEQHHDANGIVWQEPMAPWQLALLPLNYKKSPRVVEAAEKLYEQLLDAGFDVLIDDRGLRPGVMFSEMELLGMPHRIVLSERGLDAGELEYRARTDSENTIIAANEIVPFLQDKLATR